MYHRVATAQLALANMDVSIIHLSVPGGRGWSITPPGSANRYGSSIWNWSQLAGGAGVGDAAPGGAGVVSALASMAALASAVS